MSLHAEPPPLNPWDHILFIGKVQGVERYIHTASTAELKAKLSYFILLFCNLTKELPQNWKTSATFKAEDPKGCELSDLIKALEQDLADQHNVSDRAVTLRVLLRLGYTIAKSRDPQATHTPASSTS